MDVINILSKIGRGTLKVVNALATEMRKQNELREGYSRKSDSELSEISSSSTFFGASPKEKMMAQAVLDHRKREKERAEKQ